MQPFHSDNHLEDQIAEREIVTSSLLASPLPAHRLTECPQSKTTDGKNTEDKYKTQD